MDKPHNSMFRIINMCLVPQLTLAPKFLYDAYSKTATSSSVLNTQFFPGFEKILNDCYRVVLIFYE